MIEAEKILNHLTLTSDNAEPHLLQLFQLLKDGKISLTNQIAEVMLRFPTEITPFLFDVFGNLEESVDLKAACLQLLVPNVPFFVKIALEDELQRIANNPTEEEKGINLDKKAHEVLNGFI
ncbi:DUF5071 domain-containing protein [Lysinibacillus telephonicus]|nr:DUF5071 domain-containing protein [Lysinibacillus telephonicus]